MSTFRIIPCLDIENNQVVKGVRFLELKHAGNPIKLAKEYNQDGADELIFLDITASHEKRKIVQNLVKKVAQEIFIPFCVGGGIRTFKDIKMILHEGADKVTLNTAAFKNPSLLTEGAQVFGTQCIIVAIDVKFNGSYYEVFLNGGRTPTQKNAIEWVKEAEARGAGEILLTSMNQDGTKSGFDCKLIDEVCSSISIPVIASGGVGQLSHFKDAYNAGASAALAASVFHFKTFSIQNVKKYLLHQNIHVRTLR